MLKLGEHIVITSNLDIRAVDYLIGISEKYATKNAAKKGIKRGEIFINGKIASTGWMIKKGDLIEWYDTEASIPKAYDLDIPIIFEDEHLVIVNKPAGLVISGNQFKTLVNALIGKVKLSTSKDAWKWVKPVHRLDAQTSGLVVCSKNNAIHTKLAKAFEERSIKKTYHAIVHGTPSENHGKIEFPIDELQSESHYHCIQSVPSLRNGSYSLLELQPKTGRTHQLRIHCSKIGHPIVGDKLYAHEHGTMTHKGLFLCASKLQFQHPITEKLIDVSIPMPSKFEALLDREQRRYTNYHSS